MKKTLQIHMGGRHFIIDEDAYQQLSSYIESLKKHFVNDGDTGREIVEDIEQRIAELLENKIINGRQAVTLEDVKETIHTLGNIEDFVFNVQEVNHETYQDRKTHRRLYRDPDNYYLGGVASGLSEYFDIDPLWIRLAFVAALFLKGIGVLIYLILWLVVPKARSRADKLQMKGKPVNLSTIQETVNEEIEKARTSGHSSANNQARSTLEGIMRTIGLVIVAMFKFGLAALGVLFLIIGSVFLAVLIMLVMGFTNVLEHFTLWNGFYLPQFHDFFANSTQYYAAVIAFLVLVLIPIATLIYGGVKILFHIRSRHPVLRAFLLTSWILALILLITLLITNVSNSPIEASGAETTEIIPVKSTTMIIDTYDNLDNRSLTHYHIFGHRFNYSSWNDALYKEARFRIAASDDSEIHVNVHKKLKNVDMDHAYRYLSRVDYNWLQRDSLIRLDRYFNTDEDDFWMFAEVDVEILIPTGQKVMLTDALCESLIDKQKEQYCRSRSLAGKQSIMSSGGQLEPVQ